MDIADRQISSDDELPTTQDYLAPVTEEMDPEERAELEHNAHNVQPSPANKLVFVLG